MASRFSIEAVFGAKDKMTKVIKKMANSNNKFTKQVRKDYALAARSADRFTSSLSKRGNQAMKRTAQIGGVALAGGLALAVKQYVQFDDAIFGATAKMGGLDITTEKGRKTMEAMRKTARKVGSDTQFNATQAAQGLEFLAMAGFSAEQSMSLLPGVADLATVANVDFARATDIASDALGAFGLMSKDTAQLTANFARVQDVMAATVTKTNTTMEDLFETIKFGAPAFTAAGQSMETFNAIAGRMASSGIKGSNAGTALRSAITRLQKPTKDVRKGLKAFGLDMASITKDGKLLDMVDIMQKMEDGGKKLTTVQKNAALVSIVGKNAFSGWAAVMNEGVGETKKLKKELEGAGGTAAKMAAIMRNSFGNKLKSVFSKLEDKAFDLFSAFDKDGRLGIDSFINAIKNFDVTPIVNGLKAFASIVQILFTVVGPFIPMIITLIGLWKIYKGALIAAQVAQIAMNVVMAANPIGLVILAVGALVIAFVALKDNWDIITLSFEIGFQKMIMGWKAVKFQALDFLSTIGLVQKKTAQDAFAEAFEATQKFDLLRLERASLFQKKGLKFDPFTLQTTGQQVGGKKEKDSAPVTQRQSFSDSILASVKSSTDINIRNSSGNDVDSGGQNIRPGFKRTLQTSG